MKQIYLDYSATTPVDPLVLKAMMPYFSNEFGNPNSLHQKGQTARKAVEKSRETVTKFLNCNPEEIIFTSCATEANNLSLKGAVEAWKKNNPGKTPHIIVSPIEHHCVLDTVHHLREQGVKISWLKIDKNGLVDPLELKKLITPNTVLVSVMYGNNEVGTIEPIKEIANSLQLIAKSSKPSAMSHKPLLHTDAVQAIQYLDCDVKKLGVDLLSASAHKFYGPKGVGFLFVKKGTPIIRQLDGGKQENNLRAGTENVFGIVGLGKALELINKKEGLRLTKLRDYLLNNLTKKISNCYVTGDRKKRLPHIASVVIQGAEGEAMLLHLNDLGIFASSGSACTSGSLVASHVLLSMGIKPEIAHGSLRFSLGKETTKEQIDYLIYHLSKIVDKLRRMNPLSVIK